MPTEEEAGRKRTRRLLVKNALLTLTAVSSLLFAERDEYFREAPVIAAWLILLIPPLTTTTIALLGWWWSAITLLALKQHARRLLVASGICGMALFFGGKWISRIYGMDPPMYLFFVGTSMMFSGLLLAPTALFLVGRELHLRRSRMKN